MSSLAYNTERVLKLLSELPPAKVDEVVDFAEYLKEKTLKKTHDKQSADELPLYHLGAVDRNFRSCTDCTDD